MSQHFGIRQTHLVLYTWNATKMNIEIELTNIG